MEPRKQASENKNSKIFSPGRTGVSYNYVKYRGREELRAIAGHRRRAKIFFIIGHPGTRRRCASRLTQEQTGSRKSSHQNSLRTVKHDSLFAVFMVQTILAPESDNFNRGPVAARRSVVQAALPALARLGRRQSA